MFCMMINNNNFCSPTKPKIPLSRKDLVSKADFVHDFEARTCEPRFANSLRLSR